MSHEIPENHLVETRDGSHTVYSSRFDQHYHNPNGAVAESRYVFFEQTGLPDTLNQQQKEITILEIGFGTGLNLMLLLDYYLSSQSKAHIQYYTIEAFPLKTEIAQQFNYENHLIHPEIARKVIALFDDLEEGYNHFTLLDNINVHLFNGFFSDFNPDPVGADYIFHDAFSPDTNPDLWTGEVFKTLARHSHPNAILSTYCAASKVQGAMAWAGWKVAKTQGALGKREMIVASLNEEPIAHLERVNEKRLVRRYEEEDF
jgi:tRNA U34 5-methylaminomethyl-2-thiouridine-forming methyltransferase MnmC